MKALNFFSSLIIIVIIIVYYHGVHYGLPSWSFKCGYTATVTNRDGLDVVDGEVRRTIIRGEGRSSLKMARSC